MASNEQTKDVIDTIQVDFNASFEALQRHFEEAKRRYEEKWDN